MSDIENNRPHSPSYDTASQQQRPPPYTGSPQPPKTSPPSQITSPPDHDHVVNVIYTPQTQVVYIQTLPAPDYRPEYKGTVSVGLGVSLIVLHTVAIILNATSFHLQRRRCNELCGNSATVFFPPVYIAPLVYVTAGFLIAAGKVKTKCRIVTSLTLSVIASVLYFCYIGTMIVAMVIDVRDLESYKSYTSIYRTSLALSAVMFVLAVVMFILAVYASTLSCCTKQTIVQTAATGGATGSTNVSQQTTKHQI